MTCPSCGHATSVCDSRHVSGNTRRRRVCRSKKCGYRFTTKEVVFDATAARTVLTLDLVAWIENGEIMVRPSTEDGLSRIGPPLRKVAP